MSSADSACSGAALVHQRGAPAALLLPKGDGRLHGRRLVVAHADDVAHAPVVPRRGLGRGAVRVQALGGRRTLSSVSSMRMRAFAVATKQR